MRINKKERFVNQRYLDTAINTFEFYFGKKMKLLKKVFSNEAAGMGAFYLEYIHKNTGYIIKFDCQKLTFCITLHKHNGGEASVMGTCQSVLKSSYGNDPWNDGEMNEINIKRAIYELYIMLTNIPNEIPFYIYKDDEVYLDLNGTISLIEDHSTIVI